MEELTAPRATRHGEPGRQQTIRLELPPKDSWNIVHQFALDVGIANPLVVAVSGELGPEWADVTVTLSLQQARKSRDELLGSYFRFCCSPIAHALDHALNEHA